MLYFKPGCERIEGLWVNQSLHKPAATKPPLCVGHLHAYHIAHIQLRGTDWTLPLEGALGYNSGLCEPPAPFLSAAGQPTCTLVGREVESLMSLESVSEVGSQGQRQGNFTDVVEVFQMKRKSSNVQQSGLPAPTVKRCRCHWGC